MVEIGAILNNVSLVKESWKIGMGENGEIIDLNLTFILKLGMN